MLQPSGSVNGYRKYPSFESVGGNRHESTNWNNPCKWMTDLFQAFNYLPQDFPGEATSADHRKIAYQNYNLGGATTPGWSRWSGHYEELWSWQRPVHEHGHTLHFTTMRTYNTMHTYTPVVGESFAEMSMAYTCPAGVAPSWMGQGVMYYPLVSLEVNGYNINAVQQPYAAANTPYNDEGVSSLGARVYGLQVWWTYVSHYAGKPYVVGRIAADADALPGPTQQHNTAITKLRFYLAGRNQFMVFTENLLENTDGVLRPPPREEGSEHPITVISGRHPATFYLC